MKKQHLVNLHRIQSKDDKKCPLVNLHRLQVKVVRNALIVNLHWVQSKGGKECPLVNVHRFVLKQIPHTNNSYLLKRIHNWQSYTMVIENIKYNYVYIFYRK